MPYNTYNRDPYQTIARYAGTCAGCGKKIAKGQQVYIWPTAPRGKKARCSCAEGEYREFLSAAADERAYAGSGNPFA